MRQNAPLAASKNEGMLEYSGSLLPARKEAEHNLRACLTDSPYRLLKAAKRRLGCGQTRTVRNTRLMETLSERPDGRGMGYHQALVPGLLYFDRRYARGGERLFLPGAYRLPLAISPDRHRCASDGTHVV